MKSIARALIGGIILLAYTRYFNLPVWPAVGLVVLAEVVSVLLRLVLPHRPKAKQK